MTKLQQTIVPLDRPLNLEQTLMSGQCFSWQPDPPHQHWQGWLAGHRCRLETDPTANQLLVSGVSAPQIRHYFSLDLDLESLRSTFPEDAHLQKAAQELSGLRIIRDDPWECMVNFLCSSQKQIPQIVLLNHRLRTQLPGRSPNSFPGPEAIYQSGESTLRRYRLGYRARFVHGVARDIHLKQWNPDRLRDLTTDEASDYLCRLPGVGPKIAHCILLYGHQRLDAFPIDVWMSRILQHLYFQKRKKPLSAPLLFDFARDYFGPYCGYAQLILFHAFRSGLIPLHT